MRSRVMFGLVHRAWKRRPVVGVPRRASGTRRRRRAPSEVSADRHQRHGRDARGATDGGDRRRSERLHPGAAGGGTAARPPRSAGEHPARRAAVRPGHGRSRRASRGARRKTVRARSFPLSGKVPVEAIGVLRTGQGVGAFTLESVTVSGVAVPKSMLQELVAYYSRSDDAAGGPQPRSAIPSARQDPRDSHGSRTGRHRAVGVSRRGDDGLRRVPADAAPVPEGRRSAEGGRLRPRRPQHHRGSRCIAFRCDTKIAGGCSRSPRCAKDRPSRPPAT